MELGEGFVIDGRLGVLVGWLLGWLVRVLCVMAVITVSSKTRPLDLETKTNNGIATIFFV